MVLGDAKAQGVKREAITIPGPDFDVPCLLYSPLDAKASSAYLHIHGGGYVAGSIEGSDAMNTRIAAQLGGGGFDGRVPFSARASGTSTPYRLLRGSGLAAPAG